MKRSRVPEFVLDKLDEVEQAVEHLSEKVGHTENSIPAARTRLTGTFRTLAEEQDLQATLKQMIEDLPVLRQKLHDARSTLASCKEWIAALPDDVVIEPIKVTTNGYDFAEVNRKLQDAQNELKTLAAVPMPSADIEDRIRAYVQATGRPKITGVGESATLYVDWPATNSLALMAVLLEDQMVEVLMREVERITNTPMPPAERRKRMSELRREIDTLQRQALALGADAYDLPPEVILGVRVARREQIKRVERREHAA